MEQKYAITNEMFVQMLVAGITADVNQTYYEDLVLTTPLFAQFVGFHGDVEACVEIVAEKLKIKPMPADFRQAKFVQMIVSVLKNISALPMLSKEELFDYISRCSEAINYEVDIEKSTDSVFANLFLNSLN